jgi:2-dehydropantoate 2-reductase
MNIPVDKRLEGTSRVGAFKTSMLQDLEAGKPFELEPIVGVVVELADRLGLAIPHNSDPLHVHEAVGERCHTFPPFLVFLG